MALVTFCADVTEGRYGMLNHLFRRRTTSDRHLDATYLDLPYIPDHAAGRAG